MTIPPIDVAVLYGFIADLICRTEYIGDVERDTSVV